jgi:hypothetical protein
MSVNKYKPHLYVIPEDDADRQIANGFEQHPSATRQIQVVAEAGGWAEVLEIFRTEYVPLLQQSVNTHVVMLIDFDGALDARRSVFEAAIPKTLRDRVFIVGPRDTPEILRQSIMRGYEDIGRSLANDCINNQSGTWAHEHLRHNEAERIRLANCLRPFIFS